MNIQACIFETKHSIISIWQATTVTPTDVFFDSCLQLSGWLQSSHFLTRFYLYMFLTLIAKTSVIFMYSQKHSGTVYKPSYMWYI